jgi:hypothetical protein
MAHAQRRQNIVQVIGKRLVAPSDVPPPLFREINLASIAILDKPLTHRRPCAELFSSQSPESSITPKYTQRNTQNERRSTHHELTSDDSL